MMRTIASCTIQGNQVVDMREEENDNSTKSFYIRVGTVTDKDNKQFVTMEKFDTFIEAIVNFNEHVFNILLGIENNGIIVIV